MGGAALVWYNVLMKTKQLECKHCGKNIEIPQKEFTRQTKKGRPLDKWFCSGSCAAKVTNKEWPDSAKKKRDARARTLAKENMAKGLIPVKDSGHPFASLRKKVHNGIKRRGGDKSIDAEYLMELYKKQKGICALSGVKMQVNRHYSDSNSPFSVSVDRIDNSKGYYKNNIQLVCFSVNLARNGFSVETIKNFIDTMRLENGGVEPPS